ncbi:MULTISPECIES: MFS transporter [Gordonia]|uniref:Putative drug resistance protein n=1 Tax=Gordonia sihwensis NBRC 108236 TaxID=1223544 RepID=L7LN27_9ACTN|nr:MULTISPECIES: MFS transporter [Gordonia]AUH67449.1 MFS transporter [Gordonia sp. YC-JH1]GAC62525.1 putative drug resistance protein [Gordonia sihwensis NBRC 108236]
MTASPTTGSTGYSTVRAWLATAVLSASLLVIVMDMTILNIALPAMSADLEPTASQLLWIVDVYSLVLAGLLVPAASLADRWGRKRMLLAGYAVFGAASLLVLVAESATAVIAIRALLGIGGAFIMPTTLSTIRVLFTDARQRARALAVWSSVAGLGAAIGPLVGGFLVEHFSWQSAFLVNAPLMALAVVAGVFLLPESRSADPGVWDWLGIALSFSGMVLLMWSVKHFGAESSLLVPEGWAAFAAGVLLLTVFVRRSLRQDRPMLDVGLFRSRVFTGGIAGALGSMFAMAAALLLLAQWLQSVEGSSPIRAGLQLVPLAVASAAASLAAPRLAERVGPRIVIAGGIAVAGIGMIAVYLIPGELHYASAVVSLILVGVGIGSLAIGSALIMSGSPENRAGNAAAMEETSYELGSVIGVALLGSVAAVLYRSRLDDSGALDDLDPRLHDAARESIGSAAGVADQLHMPNLAQQAGTAFTDSLQITSLTGGLIMLAVAAAVYALVPAGTRIDAEVVEG